MMRRSASSIEGSGSAEDHSHYRQMVGSIYGIEWAKQNLKDVIILGNNSYSYLK